MDIMKENDVRKHSPSTRVPPEPKFILKREMGIVHCFNLPNSEDENDCKYLYVGTEEGEVFVWDLTTLSVSLKPKLGSSIQNIHFYNSTMITQEKEGEIKVFELKSGNFNQIHSTITTDGSFCKSIMIEHRLFTAAETVDIYDMETMTKEKNLTPHTEKKLGMIMSLTEIVLEDSRSYIMVLYETGDAIFWDFSNSKTVDQVLFKPQPLSSTFNKKNGRGLVVGASNTIQVFKVSTSGSKIIYEIEVPTKGSLTVVESRPDGRLFVVGGSDGRLRCFSWKTLKLLVVLTEHNHPITSIRFPPKRISTCCEKPLVVSSADGVISFWDIY
ncbi:guanine nucleotide-binding protein subunit beta-like protein 1 [Coccinella septempunctata]|uniref:guanine nucleotide-binding protein subunit beta-like protein 1 n=1 Tax=Coccinella septempunctata TaxID=41139 RepID=UPI001D06AABE|nr:guanine nucleotide-binding protein subunit beta-like protein 1 [Coccinella septempunctata]